MGRSMVGFVLPTTATSLHFSDCIANRNACTHGIDARTKPVEKTSAFVLPVSRSTWIVRNRRTSSKYPTSMVNEEESLPPENGDGHAPSDEGDNRHNFVRKFDPNSETDAFGRDPRKETQFWMGAAKSLLESDEVKEAIEAHAAEGGNGDGLTDEQRAHLEFMKSLDRDAEKEE